MSSAKRIEHQVSAGGVVCRWVNYQLEVVLCGNHQPKLWALPKGGPDPSETLQETALREAHEETGLTVRLLAPLGTVQYWYVRAQDDTRCHKTVHFYLMTPTGGCTTLHDPEFDVVQWFPVDEAIRNMNYETEIAMVKRAIEMAPAQLVPL
jgi:8-oxo-dGTP pyrophosphatase MutT (NUDIX family)